MMSTPARSVCVTSLPNGAKVSNVDRRGIARGRCSRCKDCSQFEVESGLCCDYCGCPPGKHENMGFFSNEDLFPKEIPKPVIKQSHEISGQAQIDYSLQRDRSSVSSPILEKKPPPFPSRNQQKGLSVADLMNLPGSMRLEDAMKYLTIERSTSPEQHPALKETHFSSPDISYSGLRSKTPLSQVSETSNNDVVALLQAMDRYDKAYDKSGTASELQLNDSQGSSRLMMHSSDQINEDHSVLARGFNQAPVNTEKTNTDKTLTLNLNPMDSQPLQIIAMNEGQVIRGMLKESVILKVDIIPRHVKKQYVTWYHNNKKISPRYRVRFVNNRREVHIINLRKKDSGVYMCQVKYNDGKEKQRESCTLLLEVVIPKFTPKTALSNQLKEIRRYFNIPIRLLILRYDTAIITK